MSTLLQFGPFTCELRGVAPRRITRFDEWRWPSTERISGDNALQFLGRGPGEFTFEAALFPRHRAGHKESAIDALRAIGDAGTPLPLIRGDLKMIAWYGLASVETDETYMDRLGRPGMVALIATLTRFGRDGPGLGGISFFGR